MPKKRLGTTYRELLGATGEKRPWNYEDFKSLLIVLLITWPAWAMIIGLAVAEVRGVLQLFHFIPLDPTPISVPPPKICA